MAQEPEPEYRLQIRFVQGDQPVQSASPSRIRWREKSPAVIVDHEQQNGITLHATIYRADQVEPTMTTKWKPIEGGGQFQYLINVGIDESSAQHLLAFFLPPYLARKDPANLKSQTWITWGAEPEGWTKLSPTIWSRSADNPALAPGKQSGPFEAVSELGPGLLSEVGFRGDVPLPEALGEPTAADVERLFGDNGPLSPEKQTKFIRYQIIGPKVPATLKGVRDELKEAAAQPGFGFLSHLAEEADALDASTLKQKLEALVEPTDELAGRELCALRANLRRLVK